MRKVMLAAAAVGTLVAPTAAMAANGHKTPANDKTVHVCVSQKKHARVAHKCKPGEKGITLHLPAGPAGPVGPQGPAGNGFTVKDAHGNVVGTPVGYDGSDIWVLLANGTIQDVNPATGQFVPSQEMLEYASTDCSGPAYISGQYGAQSAQSPFAVAGQTAVDSPLYTASPSTVPLNVGSVYDAIDGCTTASSVDPAAQAVSPTGTTVPAPLAGPLTITKS